MYLYIKALHIIFIVTWFSGMFYIVRLFIYNTEANSQPQPNKSILQQQFTIMIRRLWLGITMPSAILTLIFGPLLWYYFSGWHIDKWLAIKLCFVVCLYAYHITLHIMFLQQSRGIFRFSSMQLRIWNEVATIFLVAIIMLATVKQSLSFVWGLLGLFLFIIMLFSAIKIYKLLRLKEKSK